MTESGDNEQENYDTKEQELTDPRQMNEEEVRAFLKSFPEFKDCNFEVEIVQAADSDSPAERIYFDEYGKQESEIARYTEAADKYATLPSEYREHYVRADPDMNVDSSSYPSNYGNVGRFQQVDPISLMKQMSHNYELASPEEELKEIEWRDQFGYPYQPDFSAQDFETPLDRNCMREHDERNLGGLYTHDDSIPAVRVNQIGKSHAELGYSRQSPNVYKVPAMPSQNIYHNVGNGVHGNEGAFNAPLQVTQRSQVTIDPFGTTRIPPSPNHKPEPQNEKFVVGSKMSPSLALEEGRPVGTSNAVAIDKTITPTHINNVTPPVTSKRSNPPAVNRSSESPMDAVLIEPNFERSNTVHELTKKFSQASLTEQKRDTTSPNSAKHVPSKRNEDGENVRRSSAAKVQDARHSENAWASQESLLHTKPSPDVNQMHSRDERASRHAEGEKNVTGDKAVHCSYTDTARRSKRNGVYSNSNEYREYVRSSENLAHEPRSAAPRLSHSSRNVQTHREERHKKRGHRSSPTSGSKGKKYCYINGEKYRILNVRGSSKPSKTASMYRSVGDQSTIAASSFYHGSSMHVKSAPSTTAQTYSNYHTYPNVRHKRHYPSLTRQGAQAGRTPNIPNFNFKDHPAHWLATMERSYNQKTPRSHRYPAALRKSRSKTTHGVNERDNLYYHPMMSRKMQGRSRTSRINRDQIHPLSMAVESELFYPSRDVPYGQSNKYRVASSMPLHGMCGPGPQMMFDTMPQQIYYNRSMWS